MQIKNRGLAVLHFSGYNAAPLVRFVCCGRHVALGIQTLNRAKAWRFLAIVIVYVSATRIGCEDSTTFQTSARSWESLCRVVRQIGKKILPPTRNKLRSFRRGQKNTFSRPRGKSMEEQKANRRYFGCQPENNRSVDAPEENSFLPHRKNRSLRLLSRHGASAQQLRKCSFFATQGKLRRVVQNHV